MAYDIFLSYTHKDAEIAASIATKLNNAGYRCFMAEKEILPAQEWSSAIHDAIVKSKVLFILITPRSKNSLWVAAEAGAAWALKKEVVPALMFVEPDELIEIINRWQSFSVETPTQIDRLIENLPLRKMNFQHSLNELMSEKFNDKRIWNNLVKIGDWEIDENSKTITGKGSFKYLLSRNKYGKSPFKINAKVSFKEYEHSARGMNAGIILGWGEESNQPRYLHLLFTGKKLVLEKTGENLRSRHLDMGVDFELKTEREYDILLSYHDHSINVSIDGKGLYSVYIEKPVYGNVGLRPWRSAMNCSHFKVSELVS